MKSINFNTGVKKYAVNGDENNCISVNISDINLLKRISEAEHIFEPVTSKLENEPTTPELLAEADREIKEKLDYIFGTDLSSHVFGDVNCLSPLDDGNFLFMAFFEAFAPLIKEDIEKSSGNFASQKNAKLGKYLPKAESASAPMQEMSLNGVKLTAKQLAFLESLK